MITNDTGYVNWVLGIVGPYGEILQLQQYLQSLQVMTKIEYVLLTKIARINSTFSSLLV